MTTAETPIAEPLVQRGPEGIIFLARRRELRLVIEPIEPVWGPGGRQISETKGKHILFREGRYITADPDEIAVLRNHKLLGDVSEGFWEVEPTAPAVSQSELQTVVDLTLDFNLPALQEMLAQEQAGWDRPALVEPLKTATARIEQLYAERAEEK